MMNRMTDEYLDWVQMSKYEPRRVDMCEINMGDYILFGIFVIGLLIWVGPF